MLAAKVGQHPFQSAKPPSRSDSRLLGNGRRLAFRSYSPDGGESTVRDPAGKGVAVLWFGLAHLLSPQRQTHFPFNY